MRRWCDCGGCHVCRLYRDHPRYRAAVRAGPARRPPPPAPCVHLGDPLTGHEREAHGLDHRRDWRWCGLGLTLGDHPPGVVCRCAGCGPGCEGYEAGD